MLITKRQRRHAQANEIYIPKTIFGHCTVDVEIVLFNGHCTSLYCSFLWTDFKKSTFSKVRVGIFGLPKWSSAIEMYD